MEGGDGESAKFTLPTLVFLRPVIRMCLVTSNNLMLVIWYAPNRIFSTNSLVSGQPINDVDTFIFHPPSLPPVFFAIATVVAFVLLGNSAVVLLNVLGCRLT